MVGEDVGRASGERACTPPTPAIPSGWWRERPRPARPTYAAAVAAAREGFRAWSAQARRGPRGGADRAAAWMRERRLELAALEVRECAKPWPEADADVCEAIDFLEYYARGAIALERGRAAPAGAGRAQRAALRPRGVAAVDRAVELPDRDPVRDDRRGAGDRQRRRAQARRAVPRLRAELVQALRAGGVPARGDLAAARRGRRGRRAGQASRACTRSPSPARMPVGPRDRPRRGRDARPASSTSSASSPSSGGKNCVIVDADADLDEAVPAIVSSAFVYAGQKCSAAARVLVHEAIAEPLIERVAGAVGCSWSARPPSSAPTCPPVIERAAQERVDALRARAASQGRIVAAVEQRPERGWFCAPDGRRRPAAGLAGAGRGDLRAAARDRARPRLRARPRDRRRPAVRADRRAVRARSRDRPLRARPHARWAISTSTAGSPARWSAASRLAATGSPARERRPAAPTTCSSSSSRRA